MKAIQVWQWMHICAIKYNLWYLVYNINKKKILIWFIIVFTNTNTTLFGLTKRANTNTIIFGLNKKGGT